ncbi:MAG: hypothetical protein NXI31_01785 [bacterium]|nr:hypothetical protein [bacterium]
MSDTAITPQLTTIPERHTSSLRFNVMPGKPVEEDLEVREYRVGHRYAEAHFDRSYRSSMKASPSHLIFLSVQVHTQKVLYLLLCREFGLDYDPNGPELLKMWPTKLTVAIPELIGDERDLVQKVWIRKVRKIRDKAYKVSIETRVGSLKVEAEVPTFLL